MRSETPALVDQTSGASADRRMIGGGTPHTATNAEADRLGWIADDGRADRRSWKAMLSLLDEGFAP